MRPLLVVANPKLIERSLLGPKRSPRRPRCLALERAVEALLAPVLLRLAGLDALGPDAELHPPDGEPTETSRTDGSEGRAVVRSQASREAELQERRLEHASDEPLVGADGGLAPDQVPAVRVDDRERIADQAIASAEVPLEVHAPDRVGPIRLHQRLR